MSDSALESKRRVKRGVLSIACYKQFTLGNEREKAQVEKRIEQIRAFAEKRGFQCGTDEDEVEINDA